MEEVLLNRTYLESLTTFDLLRLADSHGIDIPPDMDRVFIIEELLEIASLDDTAQESTESDAPAESKLTAESKFLFDVSEFSSGEAVVSAETDTSVQLEPVPLPKQYNISFVEVIIRDPLWAFVFWEIKTSEKEQFEKTQEFSGYSLKVSPWISPVDPSKARVNSFFAVPVKPDDRAWYLGLTGGIFRENQTQYKVELCVEVKGEETVLAVSNPFRLPALPTSGESRFRRNSAEAPENQLVCLSGMEDFHILRNKERSLRAKKFAGDGIHEQYSCYFLYTARTLPFCPSSRTAEFIPGTMVF
jgi:hypothetical protein